MAQNTLIYVAGNPELYPLESYDDETGSYSGAIPELLERFAEAEGYEIVYFEPGRTDRRAGLADAVQVDLISSVSAGDRFADTEFLALFAADTESGTDEYGVAFTAAAPEQFVRELRAFAAQRTAADVTGELLAAAETPPARDTGVPVWLPIALGAALLAALASFAVMRRRGKARERALESRLDIDAATGFLDPAGFERAYAENVSAENSAIWYMLCFHFELGHIERLSGPGEIARFRAFAAGVLRNASRNGEILSAGENGDFLVLRQDDSPENARNWAVDVIDAMQRYICAGAELSRRDISAGVYALASCRDGFEQAVYHARQCSMCAGRDNMAARICGAASCLACREESELLGDLERGIEFGEFVLDIQLFVSARDFSVTGGEALSRWRHPKRGLLSPDRYIPLLEREDRTSELDFYNLEQVCMLLERLWEQTGRYFYISCNFSRRSFVRPELLERCREIIGRYDFPRRELIMEVTESGFIRPDEAKLMRANILAVRSLGVQIMLDDFGMGYATFHDLQEYPMDGLKLDKTLVDRMDTVQGRVIVDGIVRTGHGLGLTILAEGVENEWQVEELKKLNCDLLQGYLFAVPIPAAEAVKRVVSGDGEPEPLN